MINMASNYGVRMGLACEVHKHRELVPIERHHVFPLGEGGPDHPSNIVVVCMNGHGSIHSYIDLLKRYNGKVPWLTSINYGRKVRQVAQRGYEQIVAARETPGTAD